MINFYFPIFNNFNHWIKESIPFLSRWFCSLNYVHTLKIKWNIISIDIKIGVRYFKPFYIIGWWTDTEYFINGNIFVLKYITDIQNPGSESIHICNINFDPELFCMCYWTLGLIDINNFNLRTPICIVSCKMFSCIRTVTWFNTRSNEWMDEFCSFREGLDWNGIWKKSDIFVLVIFHK